MKEAKMKIYENIVNKAIAGKKQLAVLVDPDKCGTEKFKTLLTEMKQTPPDVILVGGSLVSASVEKAVAVLKANVDIPVILFPGNATQVVPNADALFFLSLISGRNPEFLIGQHVVAAPFVRQSGLEVIPVGYVLIDGGQATSVEYMSNTRPIPANKPEIAAATAMAGEMLGQKMIYLEAGSGAKKTVEQSTIATVRKSISVPVIVGGGIRTADATQKALQAGADVVVIGNVLEKDASVYAEIIATVRNF